MAKTSMAPQGPQDSESQRELRLTCMGNLLRATEERVYFKDLLARQSPPGR